MVRHPAKVLHVRVRLGPLLEHGHGRDPLWQAVAVKVPRGDAQRRARADVRVVLDSAQLDIDGNSEENDKGECGRVRDRRLAVPDHAQDEQDEHDGQDVFAQKRKKVAKNSQKMTKSVPATVSHKVLADDARDRRVLKEKHEEPHLDQQLLEQGLDCTVSKNHKNAQSALYLEVEREDHEADHHRHDDDEEDVEQRSDVTAKERKRQKVVNHKPKRRQKNTRLDDWLAHDQISISIAITTSRHHDHDPHLIPT